MTDNLSLFQTRMAGDLAVTLTVAPGSPGRNEINAFFFDTNGDDRDVREVVVLLTYLEFGNLTLTRSLSEAHPGHVFLIGEHFSHSGRWRIEAVFRREGLDDIRVAFDVTIR